MALRSIGTAPKEVTEDLSDPSLWKSSPFDCLQSLLSCLDYSIVQWLVFLALTNLDYASLCDEDTVRTDTSQARANGHMDEFESFKDLLRLSGDC